MCNDKSSSRVALTSIRLIMLLLISDLWKSFWFMAMPAVSLARGGIKTGSDFCNVGGFFLQVGLEACGQ